MMPQSVNSTPLLGLRHRFASSKTPVPFVSSSYNLQYCTTTWIWRVGWIISYKPLTCALALEECIVNKEQSGITTPKEESQELFLFARHGHSTENAKPFSPQKSSIERGRCKRFASDTNQQIYLSRHQFPRIYPATTVRELLFQKESSNKHPELFQEAFHPVTT
jgi:hypothetical protein